jgi:hypothetical protein
MRLDSSSLKKLYRGHALRIQKKIGQYEQTIQTLPGQTGVKYIDELSKGINKLGTWFSDGNNKKICSAYYAKAEQIY